jgi:hypothetical protein
MTSALGDVSSHSFHTSGRMCNGLADLLASNICSGWCAIIRSGMAFPRSLFTGDGSGWELESYELLSEAWSQHTHYGSPSALVLHNAAMFFAFTEPTTAADLLKRAIQLEPAERFYVERLGLVYGYSQVGMEGLQRFRVIATPERDAFAERAWYELLHATDWVLIRGAVDALNFYTCPASSLDPSFMPKLKELRQRADLLSAANREIPSELRRTLGRSCAAQAAERH